MNKDSHSKLTDRQIKEITKARYEQCAKEGVASSCCTANTATGFASEHGLYTEEDLSLIPKTALSLSRGCGNPTGFAQLQPGEVVVDFGCGAGIDVILAAKKVTPNGKVTGVDFSREMIERADAAIHEAEVSAWVDLREADLDQTNLPDQFADVVMSNCVLNLCPNKKAVYQEAFRVLKPGGRLAISDVIYTQTIDVELHGRFQSTWSGCVGGAIDKEQYFNIIRDIGFNDIQIVFEHLLSTNELTEMACCPGADYTPAPAKEDLAMTENNIESIKFTAVKPRNT